MDLGGRVRLAHLVSVVVGVPLFLIGVVMQVAKLASQRLRWLLLALSAAVLLMGNVRAIWLSSGAEADQR
jgi:uncharacterized membrane protein SirB2